MKRRILSLLLVLVIGFSLLPVSAFAAEAEEPVATVQEPEITPEPTEEPELMPEPPEEPAEEPELSSEPAEEPEPIPEPSEEPEATPEPAAEDEYQAEGGPKLIDSGTCGPDLTWTLTDDGVLTIRGTGEMDNYIIGSPWSINRVYILNVVIEAGVTSIGDRAFFDSRLLHSVSIPEGVVTIGNNAFYNCSKLSSINFPTSLTTIGETAFYSCGELTDLTIPENVINFGSGVFRSCGFATVGPLDGDYECRYGWTEEIPARAFGGCSIGNVTIPESITKFNDGAFGCYAIRSVNYSGTFYQWAAIDKGEGNTRILTAKLNFTELGYRTAGNGMCGEDLYWLLTEDGVLTVIGTGGISSDYSSSWVKAKLQDRILSVVIDHGVTGLGSYAFDQCKNLESVSLADTVTGIASYAFRNCEKLTDINIPVGAAYIGSFAFYGCTSLDNIVLPETINSISDYAFYGCSSLTGISIPAAATSIGKYAFYGCSSLTVVSIPAATTSIGEYAFALCLSLEQIRVAEDNENYSSIDGALFDKNKTVLLQIPGSFSGPLFIPESVGSIQSLAMQNCRYLTELQLPSGLTALESRALYGCTDLESVVLPEGLTQIDSSTFENCASLKSISIPAGVTAIKDAAFRGCAGLETVDLPEGLTRLGASAFDGCAGLRHITLPAGITSILDHAFRGCTGLESIDIPEGLTSVGVSAFQDCVSLRSFEMPDGVTYIGESAFEGCIGLTEIVIPENVRMIQAFAFRGCTSLAGIWVAENNPYYCSENSVLFDIAKTRLMQAPGMLSGTYAVPESVTTIDEAAFEGCGSLSCVTIPRSVSAIPASTFKDCVNLAEAGLPDGLTAIGDSAFENCRSLDGVAFPWVLSSIGSSAFRNCTGMRRVTIPETVTNIGPAAFENCSRLATICFRHGQNAALSIGAGAFFTGQPCATMVGVADVKKINKTISGYPWEADGRPATYRPWTEEQAPVSLQLEQEYFILKPGESASPVLAMEPEELADRVTWTVSEADGTPAAEAPAITVDERTGEIRAERPGTAYAVASVVFDGVEYSARCRVDVVNGEGEHPVAEDVAEDANGVHGVRLSSTKATTELFKLEYTRIQVIPELTQNNVTAQAVVLPTPAPADDAGMAVESARFTEDTVAALFSLRVVDDHTLEVIPTQAALDGYAAVKKSYASPIAVTVDGTEFVTEKLTLSVKKTEPAIKTKTVTLNSAFRWDVQSIVFTGGTVTEIVPDPAKMQPDWLTLDAEAGTVTYAGMANAKKSGKLYLLVTVEGWAVQRPVTVPVNSKSVTPKLKFSPSKLSLNLGLSDLTWTTWEITPAAFAGEEVKFSRITQGKHVYGNGEVLNVSLDGNKVEIADASECMDGKTYKVYLSVAGYESCFTVKIPSWKVNIGFSLKAKGTIDLSVPESPVTITTTLKNLNTYKRGVYVADILYGGSPVKSSFNVSSKVVDMKTVVFTLTAAKANLKPGTYTAKIRVSAGSDYYKKINFTVKQSDPVPKVSVSLKAAGSIDVLRPGTKVTLTPTVKNSYTYTLAPEDVTVTKTYDGATKAKVSEDVTGRFVISLEDGKYVVRAGSGAELSHLDKFSVKAAVAGAVSPAVTLKVIQGKAKVSQSTKSVTLLKTDRYSRDEVTLTLPDKTLSGIAKVELDTASAAKFDLKDLGNGVYAIGYAGDRITTTKSATVKLRVYLYGNLTGTPNATISVKVNIM